MVTQSHRTDLAIGLCCSMTWVWEGLQEQAGIWNSSPGLHGSLRHCLPDCALAVSWGPAQLQQPWPPWSGTMEEKWSVSSQLALVTVKKSLCRPCSWVLSAMSIHRSCTRNPLTSLDKYKILSTTTEMLGTHIETDCVSTWKNKCLEMLTLYMESFVLNQMPLRFISHPRASHSQCSVSWWRQYTNKGLLK